MATTETRGTDPEQLRQTYLSLRDQVLDAAERLGRQIELDRRMRENPFAVLGIAAGAGFVLGGGLWPLLRPMVKAAARVALTPSNLMALAAAVGAMKSRQAHDGAAEA